jgi:hypothetical protein
VELNIRAFAKFGLVVRHGKEHLLIAYREGHVQFGSTAQQVMQLDSPVNLGVIDLGTNVCLVKGLQGSQSILPEEICAVARRSESCALPTDSMTTFNHLIHDGVSECSSPSRPCRGPVIVSSDMANIE